MNFICVIKQTQGCDYTIGCGTKTLTIIADSQEEALNKVYKELYFEDYVNGECDPEYYAGGEGNLNSWRLYEIANTYDLMPVLHGWKATFDEKKRVREQERKDVEDRKKYEELKEKYG